MTRVHRYVLYLLALSLMLSIPAAARLQDDTRGAGFAMAEEVKSHFVKTRPKAGSTRSTRKPKIRATSKEPIGLGYSVYLRDEQQQAVRVDPSRTFVTGERIRFLIESSIDGYLYIFTAENDGRPELLYPHHKLNQGDNQIEAHIPLDVPSSAAKTPWFKISEGEGLEHFYFVVARTPLKDVPVGKALVAYCYKNTDGCPWVPEVKVWETLAAGLTRPAGEFAGGGFGQQIAQAEVESVSRKVELDDDDPPPSFIKLATVAADNYVITRVSIKHGK